MKIARIRCPTIASSKRPSAALGVQLANMCHLNWISRQGAAIRYMVITLLQDGLSAVTEALPLTQNTTIPLLPLPAIAAVIPTLPLPAIAAVIPSTIITVPPIFGDVIPLTEPILLLLLRSFYKGSPISETQVHVLE